jgi:hypothetical protein
MKIVARFYGRVNKLNPVPEKSYVTLKNQETGETVDSNAVTEKLLEKGIDHDGCEFEIIMEQSIDGTVTATLTKLEPKPITPEKMDEIRKEMSRFDNFDKVFNDPPDYNI